MYVLFGLTLILSLLALTSGAPSPAYPKVGGGSIRLDGHGIGGEQYSFVSKDPCLDLYCGHGRVCKISDDHLSAECVCRPNCPTHRHQVCGSDRVLYVNHCELHRTACRERRRITVEDLEKCITAFFDEQDGVNEIEDDGGDVEGQGSSPKKDSTISHLVLNKRKYPEVDGSEDPSQYHKNSVVGNMSNSVDEGSCRPLQYELMKDNLMLYHHEKVIGARPSDADYLMSLMFAEYDRNNDGSLEKSELGVVSTDRDLKPLADGCDLTDLLAYDDLDKDGRLSINEFYEAFSKLYSVSVISLDKALERNKVQAQVGESIEIKCDVTGSPMPPIVWKRYGVDLLSLKDASIQVFHDGSLYISDIQLVHGGIYTCHAERNQDVVQTHILNVTAEPVVLVTPPIQALAPGEDASLECWVASEPSAEVAWLKNDEPLSLSKVEKYQITGDGRMLTVKNLTFADTGAYMCEASDPTSMRRGISSLVIQEQPQPTAKPAQSLLLIFSGEGIGLYDPESCRIIRQIQGTDIIPGTRKYVCSGDSQVLCRWGDAVNVNQSYVYASQPELHRIIVLNLAQMGVVQAIDTDPYPARLRYVEGWDQLWIINWRSSADAGNKTFQVVRKAAEKGPHQVVHPEPIQSNFDVAYRLFVPEHGELSVKWRYGYVGHADQRGLYKLDLKYLRFVQNVDLTPYNCVPNDVVFIARFGMVVVECKEPVSGKPSGQIILDHLSDAVIQYKPDVFGTPRVSPDSMYVVTASHQLDNNFLLGVQKVKGDGLHFRFDVRTSLDISELGFFPSFRHHSFDLFASSGLKPDLLYVNLDSGHVEVLTGAGESPEKPQHSWGLPLRSLAVCPDHFHPYVATTSRQSVVVANGREKAISCEIGGVINPQRLVWTELPARS